MKQGMKGKIKAWVYTKVLGDFRWQIRMLFAFAIFASPIIIMQQTLSIILPTLTEEKGEIVQISGHMTNILIVVSLVCIVTQLYKMIEKKIFCLGLMVNAFNAAISCLLYKGFLEVFGRYAVEITPCAAPYLISLTAVGIVYWHIWKIMMS